MSEITYKTVIVNTVAKVGSSNFLKCKYSQSKDVSHGHNLLKLKDALSKKSNCLIIVGIRNPIDRNLSYLFQSFNDKFYNDVGTRMNNYEGEFCYIPKMTDNENPIYKNSNIKIKFSAEKIIDLYFRLLIINVIFLLLFLMLLTHCFRAKYSFHNSVHSPGRTPRSPARPDRARSVRPRPHSVRRPGPRSAGPD